MENYGEAMLRIIGTAVGAGIGISSIVKAGTSAYKAVAATYGDDVARAIAEYGDDIAEIAKHYGDDVVTMAKRHFADIDDYLLKNPPNISGMSQTIPYDEYIDVLNRSSHNSHSKNAMLGKYDGGNSLNYINKAKDNGYAYFDLGDDWNLIKRTYGLTDEQMFKAFNEPFLDDIIENGKTVYFSHDPVGDVKMLGKELEYLKLNGYEYDEISKIAKPMF